MADQPRGTFGDYTAPREGIYDPWANGINAFMGGSQYGADRAAQERERKFSEESRGRTRKEWKTDDEINAAVATHLADPYYKTDDSEELLPGDAVPVNEVYASYGAGTAAPMNEVYASYGAGTAAPANTVTATYGGMPGPTREQTATATAPAIAAPPGVAAAATPAIAGQPGMATASAPAIGASRKRPPGMMSPEYLLKQSENDLVLASIYEKGDAVRYGDKAQALKASAQAKFGAYLEKGVVGAMGALKGSPKDFNKWKSEFPTVASMAGLDDDSFVRREDRKGKAGDGTQYPVPGYVFRNDATGEEFFRSEEEINGQVQAIRGSDTAYAGGIALAREARNEKANRVNMQATQAQGDQQLVLKDKELQMQSLSEYNRRAEALTSRGDAAAAARVKAHSDGLATVMEKGPGYIEDALKGVFRQGDNGEVIGVSGATLKGVSFMEAGGKSNTDLNTVLASGRVSYADIVSKAQNIVLSSVNDDGRQAVSYADASRYAMIAAALEIKMRDPNYNAKTGPAIIVDARNVAYQLSQDPITGKPALFLAGGGGKVRQAPYILEGSIEALNMYDRLADAQAAQAQQGGMTGPSTPPAAAK